MTDRDFTVIEIVERLKQGKTSVKEFIDDLVIRAQAVNHEINAIVDLRIQYIIQQAQILDQTKQDGSHLGRMFGVPIGVSDNISTFDFFTEVGSKIHKGQQLNKDSTVVQRLRNENAIIFGKTCLTEFACSQPTITLNPHDKSTSPGGSASGGAASVAAGIVPLTVASQTNGSIIRSASYCGVYGYKPTNNIIPNTGLITKSDTLDTIGFFSRNIEDLGYVLEVVGGDDGTDLKTIGSSRSKNYLEIISQEPPFDPKFLYAKTSSLKKLSRSAQSVINRFRKKIKNHLTELNLLELVSSSESLHQTIFEVELSLNLAKEYEQHKHLLSPALKQKIRYGSKISGCDYLLALKRREEVKTALQEMFEHFDAILVPSSIDSAPLLNTKNTGDPCLSTIWSLCGFPMISLPILKLKNGMPYGIQLIGSPNDDARLLRTANWLTKNFGENNE